MSFSKKLARFALSGALAMSMVLPNSLAVFQAKVNAIRFTCVNPPAVQ